MTAYNDNQVIEDLIIDITIGLEEGDKASATLSACQSTIKKSLNRAREILEEYDDKELARKYIKQISDLLLKSLIVQRKLSLKDLEAEFDDPDR
jgi:cob(I)alamin adenosyltransferase